LQQEKSDNLIYSDGAIIRGDTTKKKLAIVFTGDEFADGGYCIDSVLEQQQIKASFFFTGRFYRNPAFRPLIKQLVKQGHYMGAHSDQHLLYCDWTKRDSLLVTKEQFAKDLEKNYAIMQSFGIQRKAARFFLPPYEWYNDSIATWTKAAGLQLINFTPGTRSNADYTTPAMKNYRSSAAIMESINEYESNHSYGLNGFILLLHIGTDVARTDKLYRQLPQLIAMLKKKGYDCVRVNELLNITF
jgi:endoglucanase